MSDRKNMKSFETNTWTGGPALGGAGKGDDTFRALYASPKKKVGPDTFVASFVSEEKARALSKSKAPENVTQPDQEVLEDIKRRAWEEAFSQGEKAGLEEGRKKTQEIIGQLQKILTEIETAWANLIKIHETRIIELVCMITEKVVYGQAAVDQEMVKRVIIDALGVIPEPVDVEITVNPGDYEYIETVKEDFFTQIKGLKGVSVIPDSAIHQGGCSVKTKFGEVDATLEKRLEAIHGCILKTNGRKRNIA